jgi:hypothetical protein
LKVDDLGAGGLTFVDSGVANSNPAHQFTRGGLQLSVERPLGATGSMGHWAAVRMHSVSIPDSMLLVATFERPSRVPLGTSPDEGTYAPSLLINTGTLMGATSQFRPEGVRLNLPGTGIMANRPPIAQASADKILDPQHPSTFTLALTVNRTTSAGKAFLFVSNDEQDSIPFTFQSLTASTPIHDIRAGIGTANGFEYRASVFLLDFQIWAPAA